MKRKYLSFLFMLCIICSGLLFGQDKTFSLLVSGYGSIPTGDYGKNLGNFPRFTRRHGFDHGQKVGLAENGYGLGVELQTPVLTEGISWLLSARFIMNPTDPSEAEDAFNALNGDTMNVVYQTGEWYHFPIMTGLRYKLEVMDNIALSIMAQGGLNLIQAASREGSRNGIKGEETSFDIQRAFGFEFGLGLDLYKKFNFQVTYMNFGTPRFEGNRYLSELVFPDILQRNNAILGEAHSVEMVLVSIGYYLF